MAFRDRFDKIISYFDTDDVSDVEDTVDAEPELAEPAVSPQRETTEVTEPAETPTLHRPKAPTTKPNHQRQVSQPVSAEQVIPNVERPQAPTHREPRNTHTQPRLPERPQAPTSRPHQSTSRLQEQAAKTGQTQITIKHPLRYEDATAIAEAFVSGQCLLVDFEYMQDAQARRCLDFLNGASAVARGTLQRVGATMYLLTPENVLVTMEDALQQGGQEATYDYDIKRR